MHINYLLGDLKMTNKVEMDATLFSNIFEEVSSKGLEAVPQIMTLLFNEAMKIERAKAIGAELYERSEERKGHANGYKPKSMDTRFGKIRLSIPQARDMEFYPQCIEKGERSERALKTAVAQMYISGVSTRRVKEVTEILCGMEVSSSQVSKVTALLDEEFEKFRNRKLGEIRYLILDAKYQKVRVDSQVISQAVMVAIGVNALGLREVLGVAVKSSEAEVNWREFLDSLKQRGIYGIELIVSDDHAGLKNARNCVFPNIPWQRCQFHFAQNAQHKAKNKAQKQEIGTAVKSIFKQLTLELANIHLQKVVAQFKDTNRDFVDWLEQNIHECFNVYKFPENCRSKIRTSNSLERVNREINRRNSIVGIFPNKDSLLRLTTAVLIEIHEGWITATNSYINFDAFDHKPL